VGCASDPPASPPAPAKVNAPIKEIELTTVTLTADAEHRLAIGTAKVERREVARTRTYPGRVESIPGTGASIVAPVAGLVVAAGATAPLPGSRVTRGEVLLRLKPLVAAESDVLARTERDVSVAQSRVDASQTRADRLAKLVKDGAASQRAADEAATERDVAKADLVAATSRGHRVRQDPFASDVAMPLRAPDAGTVLRLTASPGQVVAAGTPLVEIARVDRAWVRVAVYAGDLETIARKAPGSAQRVGGRDVRELTPVEAPALADAASSTVELVYAIDNADAALLPGHQVLATLVLAGESSSLAVPRASVIYDLYGGAWVYTTSAPHVFARKRVEIRDVIGDVAVLARGPEPGTTVVTTGASELYGIEFGAK